MSDTFELSFQFVFALEAVWAAALGEDLVAVILVGVHDFATTELADQSILRLYLASPLDIRLFR